MTPSVQINGHFYQTRIAPIHDELTKQAQQLVGTTFFGTLLKQMRDDPFRSELFDGGRGGQVFGALYDQQLASRMSRGAGHKLVDAIVRKLKAKKAYAKQVMKQKTDVQAIVRT